MAEGESLPRGLWIVTGALVLLGAAALTGGLHWGRRHIRDAGDRKIEGTVVEVSERRRKDLEAPESSPGGRAVTTRARRAALAHWNAGIAHFQDGRYGEARKSWAACVRQDPANEECPLGLERLGRQGLGGVDRGAEPSRARRGGRGGAGAKEQR